MDNALPSEQDDLVWYTPSGVSIKVPSPPLVAEFRVYSAKAGFSSLITGTGHSWITVTNISTSTFKVGYLALNPEQTISIGTWGLTTTGKSQYYNIEAYYNTRYNKNCSLKLNLTKASFDKLNAFILKNVTWTAGNNCSNFAANCWNLVSSKTVKINSPINTPTKLASEIIRIGNNYKIKGKPSYYTNSKIPYRKDIYRSYTNRIEKAIVVLKQ